MRTTFRFEDENIVMVRGDTLSFGFETYEPGTGTEVVLSDDELDAVYFTCKKNADDTEYEFQISLGNGITKINTGQYVVRVAPEATSDLKPGSYWYDLVIEIGDDKFTILRGVLTIEWDVTRGE